MRRHADGRSPGRPAACLAAFLFALVLGPAARAESLPVDLQLVLAVDISRSMDHEEQRLQRDGYVEAFRHPRVIAAIRAGRIGRIAVTYVEWAGSGLQRVLVPWTLIDGRETAEAFVRTLAAAELVGLRRTSISSALSYAGTLFDKGGFASDNRVVDVSGDGPNNAGLPVTVVRDVLVERGIVINGLPVMLREGSRAGFFDIDRLDEYYEDCVIGGFGAFIVSVRHREEFAVAIRRKLIQEIARAGWPRLLPAQLAAPAPATDCLIGEKLWQEYMSGQE